jgi:hypothetical protein
MQQQLAAAVAPNSFLCPDIKMYAICMQSKVLPIFLMKITLHYVFISIDYSFEFSIFTDGIISTWAKNKNQKREV